MRCGAVLCLAVAALGCRTPTQVTLELSTDVPCSTVRTTTLTVGDFQALDEKDPTAVTDDCDDGEALHRIGSLVVVPSDAKDAEFGVKVVLGIDTRADQCAAPDYEGCIVARRKMRFLPQTELLLPITLRGTCKDARCGADQTCVFTQCVPAAVPRPELCTGEALACDEVALTPCGDTRSDPANCGQCSDACPEGQTCAQGTCVVP